jgi:alpha-beta hydrolase superfamily lysophospholipase
LVSYDSILLRHDLPVRRAYVLFHGLTASPLQFEAFGRLLFDRGANVFIPRLPHHGYGDRMTPALEKLTSAELLEFGETAYERASELADEVCAIGFSVGGLIAAWVGQRRPVRRATAIAPFLGLAWLPRGLTEAAAWLALRVPNRYLWWDPVQRERLLPEHGYPRFPTHAVAVAAQLGADLLRAAGARAPAARDVQIVLNASESAVSNSAARALALAWARSTHQPGVLHRMLGLPASHDIIEPLRYPALVRRVYPALLALVDR